MKDKIAKIAILTGMVTILAGMVMYRSDDAHLFKFSPPYDPQAVKAMEYPIIDTVAVKAPEVKVLEVKRATTTQDEQLKQLEALLVQLRALLAQLQSL